MVIKRSPGGQACRWRAINFEIHLWSSGKNDDCIFGDRSASSMSKWRPAWTLTPEMIHFRNFRTKSMTLSMLIDLLQSVRKVWKFGRNLDIWVPMAAAPAPVSQQGEEFDVSFSKPVDSCTTSPEAISQPADLSLRKSFACHKIKRILEWW